MAWRPESAWCSRSTVPTPGGPSQSLSTRSRSGALVPPHIHTNEDEISIVLDGEIGFRSEDREVVLGAGGYIVEAARRGPRDVERRLHAAPG